HQAEAAQIGKDLDNCLLCIFGFLAAGNDQFSRAEEKNYDLGVLKPVHKARELFGLVLDPVEIEPYSDLIEVDRCREIGRGNDVLDLVGEFFRDIDTQTAELVAQNREPLGEAVNALCPGQDYLS